jgi:WD40 repeat protein
LHGPVRVADTASLGEVHLTISLEGWLDGTVEPAFVAATIVERKSKVRAETVSRRLVRSLPHTDRRASISLVSFASDGRLVVGGYPSGVVQLFDPQSGKELRTIETPRGLRASSDHMQPAREARELFVGLDDTHFDPVRNGEKKSFIRRYSGEIRHYDMLTGDPLLALRADPPRGVISLAVSRDGRKAATMEFSEGRTEDFEKLRAMYLWDVATRQSFKLRDGYGDARFAPDGKTVAITVTDYQQRTSAIYLYDTDTGKEKGRLDLESGSNPGPSFQSRGTLAAFVINDSKSTAPHIALYDLPALQLQGKLSIDGLDKDTRWGHVTFSPDGRRLAAVAKKTVYIWDVGTRRLVRSWPLEFDGGIYRFAFDADGRRLAAYTWFLPPELRESRSETVPPEDYPQPIVFLIDVASNRPERIVCPHGWQGPIAFSPDGKWLAVGGAGATHLFDVSR